MSMTTQAPVSQTIPVPVPPAPTSGKRRIEVKDLVKTYQGRNVVNGVNLFIEQGEIVGLLGPNGAGKTTTFYMVVGLVRPNAGKIFLDDLDITRQPMYRRARVGIGYLAQETSVFRKLSARENIMLVLELNKKVPANERTKRANQLLAELGMTARADIKAHSLSGGEKRRVEVARALASDPSFLLLDEPFANVDPKTIEEISNIIRLLSAKGIGVLITDHNARATLRLTDRAYILTDGKVVTQGTAREIASDPTALEYYLGEDFTL